MTTLSQSPVVLCTQSDEVTDAVCATAAALGVPCDVIDEVGALWPRWATARAVLVGGDVASRVASAGPRTRDGVYLVGYVADELTRWSMPLRAGVVHLPHGLAWLASALGGDDEASTLVAVVGGCGGVGASTLAAGLALAASRRGRPSALVDLDPMGGGLDLLLGAESTPGWRWPRLAGARGEVSDIRDVLPSVAGVTVVSGARGEGERAGPEAVTAVIRSLLRYHALVVLDAGRGLGDGVRAQVRHAQATLVVTPADVRGVAATAQLLATLEPEGPRLVARRRPASGLSAVLVADAVGLPLGGVLPHVPALARAAASGDLPPRGRRAGWARAVDRVLDDVVAATDVS